jgi:hypothetical protein
MNFSRYKADVVLIVHFLLGIAVGLSPLFVLIWIMAVFCFGLYAAFTKSIRYPEYLFAAYLVGIELLGRMSASGVPHEFIKYAISMIFVVSLLRRPKQIAYSFVIFILLFLPAIFLTDGGSLEKTRQFISANLSGPLCLGISAIYFYKKPFDVLALKKLFLSVLFPLAAILGYLVIKTPDFKEIQFGFDSNLETSVYGPNQMSSILGLGVLILGLSYFLKIRLFGNYLLAIGFIGFLLFRGLLTFSRGGMITPIILLVLVFIYFTWKVAGLNRNTIRIIFFTTVFGVLGILLFNYTNDLTGNKLSDRYRGIKRGKHIEDIDRLTSGRTLIMYIDWEIFNDNLLFGVGPGMGNALRKKYGYSLEVAAHNEFSRILAEHGLFGVGAMLIMLVVPFQRFFLSKKILERIIVIAFIGFCFVFMTHSATRIAAPCFLYGFAFVRILPSRQLTNRHRSLPLKYASIRQQVVPYDRIAIAKHNS